MKVDFRVERKTTITVKELLSRFKGTIPLPWEGDVADFNRQLLPKEVLQAETLVKDIGNNHYNWMYYYNSSQFCLPIVIEGVANEGRFIIRSTKRDLLAPTLRSSRGNIEVRPENQHYEMLKEFLHKRIINSQKTSLASNFCDFVLDNASTVGQINRFFPELVPFMFESAKEAVQAAQRKSRLSGRLKAIAESNEWRHEGVIRDYHLVRNTVADTLTTALFLPESKPQWITIYGEI
jgi:hypothetical protein